MSYDFKIEPREMPEHETFEFNVTYNLSSMLKLAGFHPELMEGQPVFKLRPAVTYVRQALTDNPDYFRKFQPENGWGSYDTCLVFVKAMDDYLLNAPDDYILKVT